MSPLIRAKYPVYQAFHTGLEENAPAIYSTLLYEYQYFPSSSLIRYHYETRLDNSSLGLIAPVGLSFYPVFNLLTLGAAVRMAWS